MKPYPLRQRSTHLCAIIYRLRGNTSFTALYMAQHIFWNFFFFSSRLKLARWNAVQERCALLRWSNFFFFLAFLISLFFFYCCLLCIFEKSYDQRTFFLPLTWYTKKSVLDFLFKIGYCALFSVVLFYERYRVYSPMNEEKKAPFFVCFDMCYLCCFHLCAVGCTVRFSFFLFLLFVAS